MCYYYTIRARFPHVPNENCLTTAELQRTLTCTERVREKGREGGAILTTIQTRKAVKEQCVQTKVTDRPCPHAFHSTKRRSENVTGEEGRNILDNFSVWLLSRFAGHSCFPARRPFSPSPVRAPCAASTTTTVLGSAQRSHC